MRTEARHQPVGTRRRWLLAWGISLALHAWLIFPRYSTMSPPLPVEEVEPAPIVLNLVSQRQLVDEPADDPDAPASVDTPYISEKTVRARDSIEGGEDQVLAQSSGDHDAGDVSEPVLESSQQTGPRYLKPAPDDASEGRADRPRDELAPAEGSSAQPRARQTPGSPGSHPDLRLSAEHANAAGQGALSLSTYAWQWVPYMRELKERIEANLHPPPAFWQLGIIEGETRLKFRILPDGTLIGPILASTSGHESLDRASLNSVSGAVPMRPLPDDFPDEYLDIGCRYYYWLPEARRSRHRSRKEPR